MYQRRLALLLLKPSLMSGTLVIVAVLAVLGYSGALYVSQNQLFYNYLFGAYGLHTFVWIQSGSTSSSWGRSLFSSPLAYYALVAAAAIAAGLATYTILQGVTLLFRWTTTLMDEAHDLSASRKAIFYEHLQRLTLRVIALAGWGVYAAFFVSSLVPFAIVLTQIGITSINQHITIGWAECLGAFVLSVVALHLHVVFARLCLLRPRLFGGTSAMEEAEIME